MSGNFYSGPQACHSSVEAIANEVAEKVKQMRTVFPDLKVGDIKPVGLTEPAGWANSVIEWTQAYKAAVGEPLVRALRQAMARTMAGAVSQIEDAAACGRDPRRRDLQRVRRCHIRHLFETFGFINRLKVIPKIAINLQWVRIPPHLRVKD
jgi:hypothetical protein